MLDLLARRRDPGLDHRPSTSGLLILTLRSAFLLQNSTCSDGLTTAVGTEIICASRNVDALQ